MTKEGALACQTQAEFRNCDGAEPSKREPEKLSNALFRQRMAVRRSRREPDLIRPFQFQENFTTRGYLRSAHPVAVHHIAPSSVLKEARILPAMGIPRSLLDELEGEAVALSDGLVFCAVLVL